MTSVFLENKILKRDGKWFVFSKDGDKKLGGPYDTKEEAVERLGQIEAFKENAQHQMKVVERDGKHFVMDGDKELSGPHATEDDAKEAMAKLKKKMIKNSVFSVVTFNISPKVRHDRMADKEYIVAPMVMLTEGVHCGSQGPLLYLEEEIGDHPEIWNHKPIVVYHPSENGKAVSACSPDVLSAQGVGVIMNAKKVKEAKGKDTITKLSAEAWFEEERLKKVDNRVHDALEKGEVMEVSTGLFTQNEDEEGEWKGEKYVGIARNFRPDHLAVLPDQIGACSVKDGAGLLRNEDAKKNNEKKVTKNEASFGAIIGLIQVALENESPGTFRWVEDVFEGFFIYRKDMKLLKRGYTASDTSAELVGEPEEVVRFVQYRSPDGTVIANAERKDDMNKKEMVDNLIAKSDGVWTEADRIFLMNKSDEWLQKLVAPTPKPVENIKECAPAPVLNSIAPQHQEKKTSTVEDYVANAPGAVREMLAHGLRAHEAAKNHLIGVITANKNNRFKKEWLETQNLETLQGLADLAKSDEKPVESAPSFPFQSYAGLADVLSKAPTSGITNAVGDEEPLVMPSIPFGKG